MNLEEEQLGDVTRSTEEFSASIAELQRNLESSSRGTEALSKSLSRTFRGALDEIVLEGAKISDVLRGVGKSIASQAYNNAVNPIVSTSGQGIVGTAVGAFSGALFGAGGSILPSVTPFAKGGVVSSATTFPMKSGVGLMGEAGPEAIMPLQRGPDGSLGVRAASGGRAINVTMNISTPDVAGFQRTQSQLSAKLSRALTSSQSLS